MTVYTRCLLSYNLPGSPRANFFRDFAEMANLDILTFSISGLNIFRSKFEFWRRAIYEAEVVRAIRSRVNKDDETQKICA